LKQGAAGDGPAASVDGSLVRPRARSRCETSIPVYDIFRRGAGISAPDIWDHKDDYKIAIAIVGASIALGVLLTFAPLFSADVALAVIACFS
jgi:hypothetical protein